MQFRKHIALILSGIFIYPLVFGPFHIAWHHAHDDVNHRYCHNMAGYPGFHENTSFSSGEGSSHSDRNKAGCDLDISSLLIEGSGYHTNQNDGYHDHKDASCSHNENSGYYAGHDKTLCPDYHEDTSCASSEEAGFYTGQNATGCHGQEDILCPGNEEPGYSSQYKGYCTGHDDASCSSEGSGCRLCEYQSSLKSLPETMVFSAIISAIKGIYKETVITEPHLQFSAPRSSRAPPFQSQG